MTAKIISLDEYRQKLEGLETRTEWGDFQPIFILTKLGTAKEHKNYIAAKQRSDVVAAYELVKDIIPNDKITELAALIADESPIIVPVHAMEEFGTNKLPIAAAAYLGAKLNLEVWEHIIQANKPQRTDKGAFYRLSQYPFFDGLVEAGKTYIIFDDTLSTGGTFASLKGYIENKGGHVLLGVALTGHEPAAKISITQKMYNSLIQKHGDELNEWWKVEIGFGLDKLTQGEAGHLLKAPSIDEIRSRIAESRPET